MFVMSWCTSYPLPASSSSLSSCVTLLAIPTPPPGSPTTRCTSKGVVTISWDNASYRGQQWRICGGGGSADWTMYNSVPSQVCTPTQVFTLYDNNTYILDDIIVTYFIPAGTTIIATELWLWSQTPNFSTTHGRSSSAIKSSSLDPL